jgi:hypothetical protein
MYSNTKKIYFILIAVATSSLLVNLLANLGENSIFTELRKVVIDNDKSSVYFITGLDSFLEKSLKGGGNVVLKFNGFGELKRESDAGVPLLIYFRTVYSLYPRKVFAVPPGVVVNTGKDIFDSNFNPDIEWMLKHHVGYAVTLSKDAEGRIYNKVEQISSNNIEGGKCD